MPIVRIRLGTRVFAPTWLMTLLTIALCILFIRLGEWQWDRGAVTQALWDAFARGADAPVALDAAQVTSLPRFKRIRVTGRFDASHQFLLDNRTHAGQAGYEVLTPLALAGGAVLLVDRGWVAFSGYRAKLPDISMAPIATDLEVSLTGRIDQLPSGGLAQGRMPPPSTGAWPRVTTYPDMPQLSAAYGRTLLPRILLLDPGVPGGYVREWQAPGLSPLRHWSYAVQWWGFAATLFVIWLVLSTRKVPSA